MVASGALSLLAGVMCVYHFRRRMCRTAIVLGAAAACAEGIAIFYGGMFATCDVNMRPSILAMAFLFFPLLPLGLPIGLGPFIAGAFGLMLAFDTLLVRGVRAAYIIAGTLLLAAITATLTTHIASALGGHPQPGNCVF
jgi:hypothetical protein